MHLNRSLKMSKPSNEWNIIIIIISEGYIKQKKKAVDKIGIGFDPKFLPKKEKWVKKKSRKHDVAFVCVCVCVVWSRESLNIPT